MISLAIWVAILWVCFGVGASALGRLRVGPSDAAEEIPFAVAIGMGVLSYLVLAVGLVGQLRVWVALCILGLLALIGCRQMIRLIQRGRGGASAPAGWRWCALPLGLFFLAAFVFTLIGALAPAGDSDYDSLVYHLAIPKVYLRDGAIHPIPWLTHSNFPFTMEMLYLLGLLLRDQALAKLFHFGCGWLTALAIFAFARRAWGARAGRIGAAVFAAIPLVSWQMTTAYNELGLALYAFLTVFALARWFEVRDNARNGGWLWVAAITCGLGLGVKMLAGAVLLFCLAAVVWGMRSASNRGRALGQVALFAVVAGAIAAPWYVKSYLWTGNPVYPFFYDVFDGRWWTAERARLYTEAQKAFGLGSGPLAFLALPWNLTMEPRWFFDQPERLRPFNVYILVFGPLLLALVPALLVAGPVGGAGRLALWSALFYAGAWLLLTQNGRYLIPILPGLCACAGLAAARLLHVPGIVRAATSVALVLGLITGLYPGLVLAAPATRVAFGAEPQSAYLTRFSQSYRSLSAVTRATPPDAKILIFGDEPRTFYLDRDYLLANHAEIFSRQDLTSRGALLGAFRDMGVSHLLLHTSTLRDMQARSGRIEALLADLEAEGEIGPLGIYGSLSLWRIANEKSGESS